MTGCTDADLHLSVAAYVLGTLEPAEESAVEAHLASCPACLEESARLAPVAGTLASLSAADLAPAGPSPDVFDRITAAVGAAAASPAPAAAAAGRTRPTRAARGRLLAVAAGVVVLAGAGVGAGVAFSGSPASSTHSVTAHGIHLVVDATPAGTGTRLALTVSGLPAQERCHLLALAADGTLHDAGSWTANYDGAAKLVESTDVTRSQLRGLTLLGNGKRLVELNT